MHVWLFHRSKEKHVLSLKAVGKIQFGNEKMSIDVENESEDLLLTCPTTCGGDIKSRTHQWIAIRRERYIKLLMSQSLLSVFFQIYEGMESELN